MEEEEDKTAYISPGKLINLNAPLLSTRRITTGINTLEIPNAANSLGDGVSWDMGCERIPFSWEQTPGKPKNYIETIPTENDCLQHPPRPPPSRWHLIKKEAVPAWECNASSKVDDPQGQGECDDSCGGDVDDDNISIGEDGSGYEDCQDVDDDDAISSNALDIFSLAQSVDTIETGDKARGTFTFRDRNLVEEEGADGAVNMISPSSNFMIQRFLPDAKALAASSALTIHKNKKSNTCTSTSTARAVSLRQLSPFSSSKGCGLDIFFPWRAKPKSGGVKNLVTALSTSKLPWSRGKIK